MYWGTAYRRLGGVVSYLATRRPGGRDRFQCSYSVLLESTRKLDKTVFLGDVGRFYSLRGVSKEWGVVGGSGGVRSVTPK